MSYTVAVVVNKDDGVLGASETFLRAHIERIPCRVIPIVGNPGYRRLGMDGGPYLASRSVLARGIRLVARKLGWATSASQDARAMAGVLRREGVQVVMAEYGPTAVSVMEACELSGVPLIAHFHGYDAYRVTLLELMRLEYGALFKQAAAIIAVSRHMERQLRDLGARPEALFYNSCGADIPEGGVANPEAADPICLMVGRLVDKKSPMTSIRAFAAAATTYPEARLDIVGDGPLRSECEVLCQELGVADRVRFLGAQPHAVVLQSMARARCFLQHSVRAEDGDMEGTPVGVLEAMGMGLPVIATRHGGILDAISDGNTGLLVDEHDLDAMTQAIIQVLRDPELAGRLGRFAREQVLSGWTTRQSVERLWQIILGVLQRGGN